MTPGSGLAATTTARASTATAVHSAREVTLLDLLDRLLSGGIVIHGEVTLAAAEIDLVNVSLRAVVGAVDSLHRDLGRRPGDEVAH